MYSVLLTASRGIMNSALRRRMLSAGSIADYYPERSNVKGDPKVIEVLNQVLKAELTAINQYFLHAEMCENWGYETLAQAHAQGVDRRDGARRETHGAHPVPRRHAQHERLLQDQHRRERRRQQLKNDLQLEYDAVKRLNDGIETCVDVGDNGSRELLEEILTDEEHHIDWLEAQLHAINEMGIENYLAQQLHEEDKETERYACSEPGPYLRIVCAAWAICRVSKRYRRRRVCDCLASELVFVSNVFS